MLLFVALIALCVCGHRPDAQAADISNGKTIALRWCSSCHLVTPDQRQGNADVPSFASIGARANFDTDAVASFLLDPHPKMPNYSLSRDEARNIAEYIASLAGKAKKPVPEKMLFDQTL